MIGESVARILGVIRQNDEDPKSVARIETRIALTGIPIDESAIGKAAPSIKQRRHDAMVVATVFAEHERRRDPTLTPEQAEARVYQDFPDLGLLQDKNYRLPSDVTMQKRVVAEAQSIVLAKRQAEGIWNQVGSVDQDLERVWATDKGRRMYAVYSAPGSATLSPAEFGEKYPYLAHDKLWPGTAARDLGLV